VPTTNEKWVGTCPPVPYGFGTYAHKKVARTHQETR